ncbi:hypothetical protein MAH1_33890 [Sessilibacter sp. MAH1]
MNNVYWPEDFPQFPLRQGYSINGQSSTIRTDMESGPPEVSRVSHINFITVTLSYRFLQSQLDDFWEFYRSAQGANDGANFFLLNLDLTGEFKLYQVRITQFPQVTPAGRKHLTISFTIETDQLGE